MPKQQKTTQFTRTLKDLEDLSNSEFIRGKKFDDIPLSDLKRLKSEDIRHLYKKNWGVE